MKLSVGANYSEEGHQIRTARETLVTLLRLLWSARGFILAVTAVIAIIAALISLLLPPRYESTTRLLPAPASVVSGDMSRMLRPEASALAGLTGLGNPPGEARFVALLRSRVIADRIIDRFELMRVYGAKYRHEARSALSGHTSIEEDRKTGVITLTVTDGIPKRAADIANAYVEELEKFNAEMNTSGAHMERVFLEKRVEEVGAELHESSLRLSQFSTKYSMLDAQEQSKSTVNAALQLRAQLIAARAELKGLEETYSSSSLKVRTAKARVHEMSQQLDAIEGNTGLDKIQDDGSLPSIHELPNLGVGYAELFRRAKLLETVQLILTQQLETAKTEEVKQLPAFRVMESAETPEQRVFPRRTFIVLFSSLGGFLLAIAFVLARNSWLLVNPDDPLKLLVGDAVGNIRQWRLSTHIRSRMRSLADRGSE